MRISDWSSDVCSSDLWHPSPSCQRRYSPPQRLSPSGHQSQGLALEALAGWVRERLRHYVMAGEQVKPSTLRKGRVTMGKVKRKARARVEFVTAMDATPERLAKGDHSEMVNPAEIDDTEQAIARVRRFRSSHLDRLHKNGRLSWRQFYAGDWYRNLHHRGRFGLQVVASYGERTTSGAVGQGAPRHEIGRASCRERGGQDR